MQCSRCRAPLAAGSTACPSCGLTFAAPVPAGVPFSSASSYAAGTADLVRRVPIMLWVLGSLGVTGLLFAGLAFAAYRSFQSHLQSRLTAGLAVREAGAGREGSWTPGAAATAQLAPPYQVAGPLGYYTVQPPAGYTLHGTKMEALDGKSVIYTWTGPANADGTAPEFSLSFGSDGGVLSSRLSSAQDVAIGLRSAERDHAQLAASPVQSGLIHGLSFSRGYWKGVGARTGRRFHGLVYCQVASPNLINMSAKDSEPSSRTTLPVLDAAALSLRLVKRMQ